MTLGEASLCLSKMAIPRRILLLAESEMAEWNAQRQRSMERRQRRVERLRRQCLAWMQARCGQKS